jgi:hypothetical protein
MVDAYEIYTTIDWNQQNVKCHLIIASVHQMTSIFHLQVIKI